MIHSKEKKNTRVKQNLLSLVPEKICNFTQPLHTIYL